MVEKTKNYGLSKPSPEEFYDVQVQNDNMDIIDGELKKLADSKPNVSGEINAHDTSDTAHPDIRTAVSEAKQSASQALIDAKRYTDQKISSIPTPDVSGQINTHNVDSFAHADIRKSVSEHSNNKNNPHGVTAAQIGAAPMYTYGTTDLTAGSSELATGQLHFVYE